jgi:hypothetical protein
MTLGIGYDSAYPPTLQQAQAAKAAAGPIPTWWGFYLPKEPFTDPVNGWTKDQILVLVSAGWIPVPICIPAPPHPADPVQLATEAFQQALDYGLTPGIAVCYNGEHIAVNGPVWLPIPGAKPTTVGPGSAIQWGQTNLWGIDVDVSASALDFPAKTALVCDLEHNVQYNSTWYITFQNTVAELSKGQAVTVTPEKPATPLPISVKVVSSSLSAGRFPGWLDVLLVGNDGNCYHYWWDTHAWQGYDIINKY